MRVWLISGGSCPSDWEVEAIFSSRDKAEEYLRRHKVNRTETKLRDGRTSVHWSTTDMSYQIEEYECDP